jgi:hypothetical protein
VVRCRRIEGSQVLDYWRDNDGLTVGHLADGDVFDCSLEPGMAYRFSPRRTTTRALVIRQQIRDTCPPPDVRHMV